MINICEKYYINKGAFQKCYIHPENENICIKVKIDKNHKDPRVDREVQYYNKIQKKNIKNCFWAKYHGTLETNFGIGYVYDLIRDETTNEVSKTVSEYLSMDDCPISFNTFELEFNKLKHLMIKHKIIVRDITGRNICCKIKNDNSIELVVIDGVGHRDFIPLVEYFQFFTKRKVNKIYQVKQLHSMEQHMKWLKK